MMETPGLMLRVRCPKCLWAQKTQSIRIIKCFGCGYQYQVFYKRKHPTIIEIVKGTKADLDKEYYRLKAQRMHKKSWKME